MKKSILFFAAVLIGALMTFGLNSCDNKGGNPLVGTWKYSTEYAHYTYVFDDKNFTFTDTNDTDTKIDQGTYELNQAECTGVLHYKTTTFKGDGQNQSFPNEEDLRFKYEIKDKSLTLTIGLDWERPRVVTLTKE
jgi:hypothetical protein